MCSSDLPTKAEPKPNTVAPNETPKTTNTQSNIEPKIKAKKPKKMFHASSVLYEEFLLKICQDV